MIDLKSLHSLLRCPGCATPELIIGALTGDLVCRSCANRYPVSDGRPVMLTADNDVFRQDDYRNAVIVDTHAEGFDWQRLIPNPSVNLASERVLGRLRELLESLPSAVVLVVGGGQQRKWLDQRLGAGDSIQLVYSDIDVSADVDLFCDGHDLPFIDAAFDAVVTTAVLEHVLYPERVAAEIVRVLKMDGILYSELPFIQQVHEGAYDFTRYTLSGHRRIFNGVRELESGMVAGPGTALVWAIENFALAFIVRPSLRNIVKAAVRIVFGWIKYFDLLLADKPAAMDGASCTYLLGRKIDGRVPDVEIVANYVGAKYLKHS
ncbi:MAG: methyltransferase domain-containing protein [Gammaproteobacteria bacterium]|nr:methyltransferase domain-containing protein [Gammaproteobacteria bacterium]